MKTKLKPCIELDLIDTNCNQCINLIRDFDKSKAHKESYKGTGLSDRYIYGNCSNDSKILFFNPSNCMPENEQCFKHRRL